MIHASPLRYPGGKYRARQLLAAQIPSETTDFRSPFTGGANVELYWMQSRQGFTCHWWNDLNSNLMDFWIETAINTDLLIAQIGRQRGFADALVGEHGFSAKDYYTLLLRIDQGDRTWRAARFFILNRITFSGLTTAGGFSKSAYERRWTHSAVQRIKRVSSIMPFYGMKFTAMSYHDVITRPTLPDREDGLRVNPKTFMFIDPPYIGNASAKLYGEMHAFDHERFAHELRFESPHPFIMTIDNHQQALDLYSSWCEIKTFDIQYGMTNVSGNAARLAQELLIRCDR